MFVADVGDVAGVVRPVEVRWRIQIYVRMLVKGIGSLCHVEDSRREYFFVCYVVDRTAFGM